MAGAEWPEKDMRNTGMEAPLFSEVQKFSESVWLWIAVTAAALGGLVPFALFLAGSTGWLPDCGRRPAGAGAPLLVPALATAVMGLVIVLLAVLRLEVEVRRDALHLRFYPLHRRFKAYPFDIIERIEDCQYSPLRDYGGWGIRYGRKGKAYNVRGNRGVMLTFRDGKHLLIGSQRSGELAAAIGRASGGRLSSS